ncbi:MAG: pilus assembly protein [Sphingomonadaceae bacterium]|nr:pilus assembly protein [Sphingomonadaceae bacterium]
MSKMQKFLRRLQNSTSGAALVEFALATPLLLTAGLWGVESAHQAIVQMRISQAAILIADNASRVGEESLLGQVQIYESDINDIFYGTHVQTGGTVELFEHGRVILSSLEVIPDSLDGANYIHWQRCMGKKVHSSSYGHEGDGLTTGGIPGMGPTGQEIIAFDGEAVMFVEVSYDYQPLVSSAFTTAGEMSATAAFNVRNNRDLTQIYQRDSGNPDPVATCDVYETVTLG